MKDISEPLKYTFTAYFEDGSVLTEPKTSIREESIELLKEVIKYNKKSKLIYFDINDGVFAYGINMPNGKFGINGTWFLLSDDGSEKSKELVYKIGEKDGTIDGFYVGYSVIKDGSKIERTIRID